jgi:diguanylate cyclase (GGDEF)-like protein/PAS domain S-box-containing protein
VDPRRWWLLAGVVPVAIACALAASNPALRPLGDLALVVSGLSIAVILWVVGGRRTERRSSWRLLATSPLFPVVGTVLAAVVAPSDPLQLVVLRWVPTVPGYLIAIAAILTLVEPARLRAGGLRLAVELALFTTASLVVVQLLVLGPAGRWSDLGTEEHLILGAAVVVTSAIMAAALTLLGVIEAHRRRMAMVLLAGTVALTAGRGLGTSALLSGAFAAVDTSRLVVAAGMWLLVAAVLVDDRPGSEEGEGSSPCRTAELGQLLPHLAMLVAVVVVAGFTVTGSGPSTVAVVGIVVSVALAAVHRWVTARDARRMAGLLRRSEAYFRSLVRSSGDAVVILGDDLRISWTSVALERALGSAAADLLGRTLPEAVHPDDAEDLAAFLPPAAAAAGGESAADGPAGAGLRLLRLRDDAGVWRYLEAGVSDLRSDPDVGAVVLHCRDMTDRHAREQALKSVAYTDPMTGLPNRAGFLQALDGALKAAAVTPGALLMIELDGLTAARQNSGREAVTLVVAEIGRRLRATVRGEDVVARMGGGAFAVVSAGTSEEADRLAARCLSVIERPVVTPTGIIDLTAGVGVVALEAGPGVEDFLARADLAVRASHADGPGSAARYSPGLGEAAARQDRLRTDLPGATTRGELFLLFQPIVSLTEQRVTGIEALLRWRHPSLGEVPPAEFLSVAERTGLLGELLRWALEEAAAAVLSLPAGEKPLRIGLKAPDAYVRTGRMVPDVEAALRGSGLPPERLVVQIGTATVVSDDPQIALDVSSLRLMGVHVALEGFGSGASALAHLTKVPVDIVKLDRSFITRLDRDGQSRALCESLVGIAKSLGLDVVGEGVETPAQLAALCGFGCDFAQGFLLARPMPLSGLAAMLAESSGALWPGLVGSR